MNIRNVIFQLGLLLQLLSALLLIIGGWEAVRLLFGQEVDMAGLWAVLASGGIGTGIGTVALVLMRHRDKYLGRREALLLVAMSWIFGAAVAGLPFLFWAFLRDTPEGAEPHLFTNFVNCYFESMSGLTTTGATVLGDIGALPGSLLFWRSLLHWLGGLGIVVLFVAVLPSLGVGGKRLFRVEAPGPAPEGLQPTIRDTARVLLYIYAGFTCSVAALLAICTPMSVFDSICHSLSMVSSGGLSTRDASVAHFDSRTAEYIILFGMILAGVNFGLFYQLAQGKWKAPLRDTELKVYLGLKLFGIAFVIANLVGTSWLTTAGTPVDGTFSESLRYGSFTTVSLQTGTGFATADYDAWPFLSRALLLGFFFTGGCAGSTTGGIKVIRLWIAIKVMLAEIEKAFRPNVVRPLRVGHGVIDHEMKLSVIAYSLGFFSLFVLGTFGIMAFEEPHGKSDFITSLTASLSTLCNVGPGLHLVGPTDNYGWFTNGSKLLMCGLMALGRLEVFALIVLFLPRFWRAD